MLMKTYNVTPEGLARGRTGRVLEVFPGGTQYLWDVREGVHDCQ